MLDWLRNKVGLTLDGETSSDKGFKSITKKSIHFRSARFRECLMEIGMMTEENSIADFVDNLEDIEILFTSMSPAVVEFFSNGYN
jgi:hypothetical protein